MFHVFLYLSVTYYGKKNPWYRISSNVPKHSKHTNFEKVNIEKEHYQIIFIFKFASGNQLFEKMFRDWLNLCVLTLIKGAKTVIFHLWHEIPKCLQKSPYIFLSRNPTTSYFKKNSLHRCRFIVFASLTLWRVNTNRDVSAQHCSFPLVYS